jgi:pimeloyl-ACP methyl ester carboxylesterase
VSGTPVRRDGSGYPVLLSGGAGMSAFDWDPVVALLTADATTGPPVSVLRFDRPGLGGGDRPRRPPRLQEEADRIAAVLRCQGLVGAVVVAHSLAAFHAEACALLWPGLVGGLVLVDPSCECPPPQWSGIGSALAGAALAAARVLDLGGAGRRLGPPLRRWLVAQQSLRGADPAPEPAVRAVYGDGRTLAAVLAEYLTYRPLAVDLERLRRTLPPPALPVTVLTATGGMSGRAARRWLACHQALASRFVGSRQVPVEDSGHLMQLDRPDAIAAAVRAMLPVDPPGRNR